MVVAYVSQYPSKKLLKQSCHAFLTFLKLEPHALSSFCFSIVVWDFC
jgi:hypothetical protein